MREDELLPPPVEDTITLLVKAARRAGFDVEPDARPRLASAAVCHAHLLRDLPAVMMMMLIIAILVALTVT